MKLKTMSVSDREHIIRLFRDVFENEPWNDDWSDEKQLDAYLMDLIGQDNSLTLGYWDKDQLTGIAMGHIKHWYTGTEYYIDELCISRDLQGRGIGTAFLNEIETYLQEHGIVQIFLQTERTVPAFRFYQNRGFEVLEDHVSLAKQSDILPPPKLTHRGGGFPAKDTPVSRYPGLIGFPVPQGTFFV